MATQTYPYRVTFLANGKTYQMPIRATSSIDAGDKSAEKMHEAFGADAQWHNAERITYDEEWNCWLAWLDARFEDAAELVQADGSYKRIGGENIFVDINDDVFHLTRDLGSDVWELRPKHPTADELEMIGVAS